MKNLLLITLLVLTFSCGKKDSNTPAPPSASAEKLEESFITETTNTSKSYSQVARREFERLINKMDFSNINLDFEFSDYEEYEDKFHLSKFNLDCLIQKQETKHLFHNKIIEKTYYLMHDIAKVAATEPKECQAYNHESITLYEFKKATAENFKQNHLENIKTFFNPEDRENDQDPIFKNVTFKIYNNRFESYDKDGNLLRRVTAGTPVSSEVVFANDYSGHGKINFKAFENLEPNSFCKIDFEYAGHFSLYRAHKLENNCIYLDNLPKKKTVKEIYLER